VEAGRNNEHAHMSYFTALQNWSPVQVQEHLKLVRGDPQLTRYFKRVLLMTKDAERVGEVLSEGQLESLWREGFSQRERALIWCK
jgi:hypothetical protein